MANYRKSIRVPIIVAGNRKRDGVGDALPKYIGNTRPNFKLKSHVSPRELHAATQAIDMRRKIAALPGLDDPMASPNYKVPTLDMPNMDMRSVRQIYQDLKKKKKLVSKNSVPVKSDQAARRKIYDDARKRINGEKLAKVYSIQDQLTELSARCDDYSARISRLNDRLCKLEHPTVPYTQDLDIKAAPGHSNAVKLYSDITKLRAVLKSLEELHSRFRLT